MVDYNLYQNIIKIMAKNKRPSLCGRSMLRMKINQFSSDNFTDLSMHNLFFCKDYLMKSNGCFRENVYIISPYLIALINYYSYYCYLTYGCEYNQYYSGDFEEWELFYNKGYENFQAQLFMESEIYKYVIKIDIMDFYSSINLNKIKEYKSENIDLILQILSKLSIEEFPLIQDCAGLSYIATCIILREVDKSFDSYFKKKFHEVSLLRYSDDLYVLFNDDIYNKEYLKNDIKKILQNYDYKLNDNKFFIESCKNLPEIMSLNLYDIYGSEDVNITRLLGNEIEIESRINKFLRGLEGISEYSRYVELTNSCFSIEIAENNNFKKNIMNEILYKPRTARIFMKTEIQELIVNIRILTKLKFDPKRLTLIILFTKNKNIIKSFMDYIYKKIEARIEEESDMMCLFTYISQRSTKRGRMREIMDLLKYNHSDIYTYIKKYNL